MSKIAAVAKGIQYSFQIYFEERFSVRILCDYNSYESGKKLKIKNLNENNFGKTFAMQFRVNWISLVTEIYNNFKHFVEID